MIAETRREQSGAFANVMFIVELSLVPTATFLHTSDTKSTTNNSRWRKPEKPCKKTGFTKYVTRLVPKCLRAREPSVETNNIMNVQQLKLCLQGKLAWILKNGLVSEWRHSGYGWWQWSLVNEWKEDTKERARKWEKVEVISSRKNGWERKVDLNAWCMSYCMWSE